MIIAGLPSALRVAGATVYPAVNAHPPIHPSHLAVKFPHLGCAVVSPLPLPLSLSVGILSLKGYPFRKVWDCERPHHSHPPPP
ncbi:hypothetical protein F4780DRAFT_720786 [Xylariomycetidae sp. FL0641]|nr:hypothetical protein F4780DRAFT_720786 [Xylariomycetidae sp. FL0641]